MPLPTFIAEYETVWNSGASPKTTSAFDVLAGDVLCVFAIRETDNNGAFGISGGSLTWTQQQSIYITDYCQVSIWTATVDTNKNMSVSVTHAGTVEYWGANVLHYRASDGVGASSKTTTTGAPTLNLTTTQANSAVVAANGDWNAVDGASRTWRANAGALTEQTYFRDSARYTVYGGYHPDAGAGG